MALEVRQIGSACSYKLVCVGCALYACEGLWVQEVVQEVVYWC